MSIAEKSYQPDSAIFKRRRAKLFELLAHTKIHKLCDEIGVNINTPTRTALYRLKSGKYPLTKTSLDLANKAMKKYIKHLEANR